MENWIKRGLSDTFRFIGVVIMAVVCAAIFTVVLFFGLIHDFIKGRIFPFMVKK